MNDMAEFSGLPSGVAEALAAGTLGDPFARTWARTTHGWDAKSAPSCPARWKSRCWHAKLANRWGDWHPPRRKACSSAG